MRLFGLRISPALLSFSAVILTALMLWPELLSDLARSSDFMPHGFCFQWQSDILTLHVLSDTMIWLSYMGLSGLLAALVWRFRVVFGRLPLWAGIASGGFIFFCGLTHLMGIVVIWQPFYWLDGGVKALTALASFATLIGGLKFRGQFIQILSAAAQRDQLLVAQQQAVTQLQTALVTRETDLTTLTQEITQQREERVRIVQALEASEERFRRVFVANPAPKLITRADNRQIVNTNPAFALLSGYTQAELIGQTTDALGLWAETSLITQARAQLSQDGQVMNRELPFRMRDGSVRELLLSVVPVELDGVACFLTVMLDQTEHKRAEVALQRSVDRLRVLADASSAFAEVGTEYQVLPDQVARTTADVLGAGCIIRLVAEDALWFHVATYYDDDPKILAMIRSDVGADSLRLDELSFTTRIFRTNQPFFLPIVALSELPEATKSEYRSLIARLGIHSLLGVPMRVHGQAIGVLILFRHQPDQPPFTADDVVLAQDLADRAALAISNARLFQQVQHELSERTRAQAALHATAAKLNTLFEVLPVGVAIANTQRQVVDFNPALKRIMKIPDQGLTTGAATTRKYIHADGTPMRPEDFASARAVQEQRPIHNVEIGVIIETGETIWTSVSAAPLAIDDLAVVVVTTDITDRKRAEAAISETEARYRSLFENMLDGYAYCQILVDHGKPSDYLFIDVNSAFKELTGLPAVVGKKVSDVIPGIHESDPALLEVYGRVALTGKPAQFETYVEALDFWFSIAVYSPRHGYFVATFDNITAHKQAELALAQSHNRLLRAEQIGHLGSWEWQSAGDQVLWSDGLYQVFGIAPQEFGATHAAFLEHIHSEDREHVKRVIDSAFRAGGTFEFENRIVRPDGQVRNLHTRGELLRDGVGASARLAGMSLDITERKQAEAMRQVSEQRFQRIFDLSPDLICIASLDGYFRLINPAFSRVLGYSPEELLNARFMNFIHPDDRASVDVVIADKLSRGETVLFFQCRYVRKDGGIVWLEWISQPAESMIFAIGRDITERKRVEQLLARKAEDLRRSNTELELFAYVASHDLQEPLRMVTSYVQLLQRRYQGQLDAKADMYIAYAVDGAARMQTLIEDLLAYSRLGRANGQPTPTDCARVLELVQANLAVMIADLGATITADPLPTVLADAGQIGQLFQNLISNAIKFHGAEPPQIHLSATRYGAEWLITVRDNGIGIDPQYVERIFVIFQRLHTRAEYPGTGIGLALCKKIVEHYGGRIWLESQLGAGTTFYFTLPRIEAAPDRRLVV